MPLETAQFINQLDAANPLGSDPIAAGDDHLRLIKAALKTTFPNITGAMTLTQGDLNTLVPGALQRGGGTMTGALTLAANPSSALQAATKQYVDNLVGTLGTLASQNANAVAVTGGSINGTPIGASTPSTVAATQVTIGAWTIVESGNKILFRSGGVTRGSLDTSGNFVVTGNVTGFGTP